MKVTLEGIEKDAASFKKAGVTLPKYDVRKVQEYTPGHPIWVHMGAGNIYHGFVASLQQSLLNQGLQQSGIITVAPFDSEAIDLIYKPHNDLVMNVTLLPDTSTELEIIASSVKDYKLDGSKPEDIKAVREIFRNPGLQMFSFTITEKGYALRDISGNYLKSVEGDFAAGPEAHLHHGMTIVAALLLERFKAGALPLAVVSMDNCSHNGEKLKAAVMEVVKAWKDKGFVGDDFIAYLENPSKITFPWSMIDKITPRPDPTIAKMLKDKGIEDMDPVKTSRGTFIAPFVNAEKPSYLVIEDTFPNGRPPLEKAGVLFTDREHVDLCERMKVTTCLNPLHTALAVYGCVLGYKLICKEMDDPQLVKLVNKLGYDEGIKVVDDPKILSPKAFLTEVIEQRLTNKCLPDSPQRIATDTSLKIPVRFGETLKNYKKKGLDASKLIALPLAIAGWLRYIIAVDDEGKPFEPSADPQLADLKKQLAGIKFGDSTSVGNNLKPLLSNRDLFGVSLYDCGLGTVVEDLLAQMIAGPGAVRATLKKYLD